MFSIYCGHKSSIKQWSRLEWLKEASVLLALVLWSTAVIDANEERMDAKRKEKKKRWKKRINSKEFNKKNNNHNNYNNNNIFWILLLFFIIIIVVVIIITITINNLKKESRMRVKCWRCSHVFSNLRRHNHACSSGEELNTLHHSKQTGV